MQKKTARIRRARRARAKFRELGVHRLCVHRSPRHIYAQILSPGGERVIASASTLDAKLKQEMGFGGNVAAAKVVGRAIAERAQAAGLEQVGFDRSGFKYHGRVRALADAAREAGLKF